MASTSAHLTRVHDGESLEDLKPWRARGVELFSDDDALPSGSRAVRGWEHMPLPSCRPPSSSREIGLAEDTAAPPALAPHLYIALVRSVLLPWGTRPPGKTSTLRVAAASELRDALGVSAEQHAAALVAARRANKGVVRKLNARLDAAAVAGGGQAAGEPGPTSDARRNNSGGEGEDESEGEGNDDGNGDGDLTAAFRLEAEKRALEPLVSDLRSLPRFDATVHVAILKVEGQSPPKPEPAPKAKQQKQPKPELGQKPRVGVGEVHSATRGVKVEDVALAEEEVPGAGGIFACCFGGGVKRAPRAAEAGRSSPYGDRSAVDLAPAPARAPEVEPTEDEVSGTATATETEIPTGHLYCTVSMMSGAGARTGTEARPGRTTYHSTPVRCAARGDATTLHACAPQMRVSCDDAATALIEVRLYWAREVEAQAQAQERDGDSEPVSERLATAAGGDGSAKAMRAGDARGQREGVLAGVASLRVADLQDTSESAAPRAMRLALRPPPNNGSSADSRAALPLRVSELTAVYIAADCFVENFVDADAGVGGSEEAGGSGGADHWVIGDNLADSCVAVASALWAGWERTGCGDSGGPLDASLRAGMHVPTWADGDVCSNRNVTAGPATNPRRHVVPPQGWRGVLWAFAALHRVPRATLALAEAEAIARRWRAGPEGTVVSELHARLATAVSAIASGRATSADASLHGKVAAVILPRAESSLSKLLAPPRGTNADEAATALRALTPVLALCLPLDTPAPKFANYLHRAARQAVMARIARDLATPLPGEAKASTEAAAAAAAAAVSRSGVAGIDDDSEYDVGSHRGAAFTQMGTEAGQVAVKADGGLVSMSTASVAAASDSEFLTLSRVTAAVETAVACFPVDLAVFRALPPGVSAAPVALHSAAAALMQAAAEATVAAGGLWAPSYGAVFAALDTALRKLRLAMHAAGLGSAAGPLAVGAVDDLLRPSLEELLASIRPRLASVLQRGVARERSPTLPPTPVAPARGAMHSASLVDLFAALRDTYIAAMPASVRNRRRVRHHSVEVEAILGAALRWYASEHERDCLTEVRTARERLWEKRVEARFTAINPKGGGKAAAGGGGRHHHEEGSSGGRIVGNGTHGGTPATLTFGFQTRLSNIHACVASLRALREDCPLLWRASSANFSAAGRWSGGGGADDLDDDGESGDDGEEAEDHEVVGNYGDQVRNDDMTSNAGSTRRKLGVGVESGVTVESTSFAELLRALRCSRASVISAATELLMDIVTPDLTTAVLSPDFETRRAATSRAFECINAELSRMDNALAAGAFRLAAAAVHRAACASLERLLLHRAHDDVSDRASAAGTSLATSYATSGGSLSGTSAPLNEVQHSRVVELTAALRDFLSVDGGGVPAQVLMDGEQRLRRLLNLWFTPTLEVVREFWRQMDITATAGGGAAAATAGRYGAVGVVRPVEGGGVGPLDLMQLLAQRGGVSSDGEAAAVVDAQLSTAASVNAQAVLSLPPGGSVVASFVCRFDKTTLAGRLFVTSSCVGFSPCGVGPDHPHDMHSAVTVPVNHVVRAFKGDANAYGSSSASESLILLLVDSRELRFECFSGGARARDLALEALRASAAASHLHAPFLVAAGALASSSLPHNPDVAQNSSNTVVVLPPGEKSRQRFSCTLHALRDETGMLHVTSAALLWLPNGEASMDSSGVGLRIQYEDINLASIATSRLGWADHVVTVGLKPKPGVETSPIRFICLTESGARALQGEIRAAATVAADSSTSVF
jgi:hypothetical protein